LHHICKSFPIHLVFPLWYFQFTAVLLLFHLITCPEISDL
jgi:hypothetical protein